MSDITKQEELKQKLFDFFDKKLTQIATKFEADIDSLEKMKIEYFNTIIIKYREIKEEHKKQESEEKEKPEKKSDNVKHSKIDKNKIDPTKRPKTSTSATQGPKVKEEKPNDIHKEKKELKSKPAVQKITTAKPS